MGETGPCGPVPEMFVDLGPQADFNFTSDPKDGVNVSDRFREFWNLVFINITGMKMANCIRYQKSMLILGWALSESLPSCRSRFQL